MAEYDYDVLVIGAGPGGYVAAIRAAQLGLKTACAEARETLGGTCLNVGCIPSKALLHASELFEEASHGALAKFGVEIEGAKLNLDQMHAEKAKAVGELTGGIEYLFKKNKVTWLKGKAAFLDSSTVKVGDQIVTARDIVIATGSVVTPLPGVEIDQKVVVDSTGALALPKVPEHLVVIGGGVIGLELGSVWRRLGAKVTVVEYLDQILPGFDGEVRKESAKLFKKQGMELKTSTKVTGVTVEGDRATVSVEPAAGGAAETLSADAVLVAIGRKPNTDGLNLEAAGVKLNGRGQVEIDHDFATNVDGVWAIGDVAPGLMLAHKAEDEGVAVAENIAGQTGIVNHDVIPSVVYTMPEIAGVGLSEEAAKERGEVKVGKFPFIGNGKAIALGEAEGFVKTVFDAKTGELLGAHMVGAEVTELIQGYVVARQLETTEAELMETVFAHPTLSEMMHESVLAAYGRAIHY